MDPVGSSRPAPILVMGIGGTLLGIDPATGEVAWSYTVDIGSDPTALVITETRIFACNAPQLVCLEYPTGKELWRASVVRSVGACLRLIDGRLYVSSERGHLECFTTEGQPLWHNKLKGRGTGAVTLGLPGSVVAGEYWR